MDEKSLELLEFPRVRQMIAEHTSFSASRELAFNVVPTDDYENIVLLLRQSAEARRLLAQETGFSIGNIKDVRETVRLAALGSILEPATLLEVYDTIAAMRELRSRLDRVSRDFPLLWQIVQDVADLRQLEKDITGCIAPSGEVLDSASPALSNLRQQLREVRGQLLSRLEAMVKTPRLSRILQEDVITERDGRYVVLVKTESRHELKGIIHDISNTGATVFIEPSVTVSLGNALRELTIQEKHEVEKILGRLSASVGSYQVEISSSIRMTAELDLVLAKARYAGKADAVEPVITKRESTQGRVLRLAEARHPLLSAKAVPLSVEIGRDYSTLLITGPNTGGKTVALKTIGLLTLMAQAGIPIPASGESQIPVFDSVFSDIGDEQSIEQTLSTFSWHMGNIIRIINHATENSLVLLDELGTSTDPAEGSALARAILRRFLQKGIMTVATTHYGDLKVFVHVTPGMQNASLDFDSVTLVPTYHLTVGVPGGSNALVTAARLGLPSEIIAEAEGMLSGRNRELETLLADMMKERQKIESLRHDLEQEKTELEGRNADLEARLKRIKAEENRLIQEARDRLVSESTELHREIRSAQSELRKERSKESIERARKALAGVRERLESEVWMVKSEQTGEAAVERPIAVGDTVWLKEGDLPAIVLSLFKDRNEVEVQAGQARVTVGLDRVARIETGGAITPPKSEVRLPPRRAVPPELDLRGKRADEVEPLLDSYLDDASLSNLREVRIIHGMGTGTVRGIVRDFLASHPLAKSFRSGRNDEGGDGVTIATL